MSGATSFSSTLGGFESAKGVRSLTALKTKKTAQKKERGAPASRKQKPSERIRQIVNGWTSYGDGTGRAATTEEKLYAIIEYLDELFAEPKARPTPATKKQGER